MVQWTYQLTDLSFVPVGEILNASERTLSLGLSKPATASFKLRFDNPLMPVISANLGYVKIYRDTRLWFVGPIIAVQEVADNLVESVSVTCAGPLWFLTKRLAGKSTTGTAFTIQDRALIAKALIDTANGENETGIRTDNLTSQASSASTYTAGPYKPVLDCMNELGKTFDGFDWGVVPIEPTTNDRATAKIGDWFATPVLGSLRPETVFEYGEGTRANLVSYQVQTSRDTQANAVWHVPSDTSIAPVIQTDSASILSWGRLEDVVAVDITDATLRQKLVDEHVSVRKQPRKLVLVKPHVDDGLGTGRVPQMGIDYGIGDTITVRAKAAGSIRLDAQVRVYGINVAIDEMGRENIDLTLVDE